MKNPNYELMTDDRGRLLTVALFLETYYKPDQAMFTFKDYDHVYQGKTFRSLKTMYIDMADPTEYEFANTHLCGWRHWQRMVDNTYLRPHIDEWRMELEFKLRSQAVKQVKEKADKGNMQAAKWLADRGWSTRAAGRPSKEEKEREKNIEKRIGDEFSADIIRLQPNQGK